MRHLKVIFFPLLGLVVMLIFAGCASTNRSDFGQQMPDQRIYDRAQVLSSADTAMLAAKAQALTTAGAPTIVYIRVMDSSPDESVQDARNLMNAWNIESANGAHDGFVVFMNLKPGDTAHGTVGLFAGAKHYQNGSLQQAELQRIIDEQMTPLLKNGQTAAGIAAGLDAALRDLLYGPPPPSPAMQTARFLGRVPLNAAVLVVLFWISTLIVLELRRRPPQIQTTATRLDPPEKIAPALAGALVMRRIADEQLAATIMDLVARGAVRMEPQGKHQVRYALVDSSRLQNTYEQALWASLERRAKDGVLTVDQVAAARSNWGPVRDALRDEMIAQGWFDRDARRLQTPFNLAAIAALIVMIAAIALGGIGQEGWPFIGMTLMIIGGTVALTVGNSLPETTQAGESAGTPWREYQRGLRASRQANAAPLNLDIAVPFAVAMGAIAALRKPMQAAGKAGYTPIWMGQSFAGTDFYVYWIVIASTTGSTGTTSGAAAGGGGAGGSF